MKNKFLILIIVLFMVLISTFTLGACDNNEPCCCDDIPEPCCCDEEDPVDLQLLPPVGLAVNEGVLTWDAAINAQHYRVRINARFPITVHGQTRLNLPLDLRVGGTYRLYVQAMGGGTEFVNSDWSAPYIFIMTPYEGAPTVNYDFFVINNNTITNLSIIGRLQTQIIVPASIKTIGANAFESAAHLTTVVFEEGSQLEAIDNRAFRRLTNLVSITIPASITTIGDEVFEGATGLESVIFLDGGGQPVGMGDSVFMGARSLNNIKLPSRLVRIGNRAFQDTENLDEIFIPAAVLYIDDYAFAGTGLRSIEFEQGSQLIQIGALAFRYAESLAAIEIPASVSRIGSAAFSRTPSLTTITFEADSQLTSIESGAFNQSGITAITLPRLLTRLSEGLFTEAGALVTVDFEAGSQLTVIEPSAFLLATSIVSISLPPSLRTIQDWAFNRVGFYADSPTVISFAPDTQLQAIGAFAFYRTINVLSITIPRSATVSNNAFHGWTANQTIYMQSRPQPNPNFSFADSNATIVWNA